MRSYGCEIEASDWDTRKGLPNKEDVRKLDLFDPKLTGSISTEDFTMVNSSGIAVDPKRQIWHLGGEVQTPPTWSIQGQLDYLGLFLAKHPDTTINYRSNLHIHIRIPGLKEDLEALKRITAFNNEWLRKKRLLDIVEPIPPPVGYGAKKRYLRRKRSHHTTLPQARIDAQLRAKTVEEFFEAEVPSKDGKPLWTMQPRAAVNLRQLLQTDTIEFRHWPGTLDQEELCSAFIWCNDYITLALGEALGDITDPWELWEHLCDARYPQFRPYVHWMEERYDRTCIEKVGRDAAAKAIEEILKEGIPTVTETRGPLGL